MTELSQMERACDVLVIPEPIPYHYIKEIWDLCRFCVTRTHTTGFQRYFSRYLRAWKLTLNLLGESETQITIRKGAPVQQTTLNILLEDGQMKISLRHQST